MREGVRRRERERERETDEGRRKRCGSECHRRFVGGSDIPGEIGGLGLVHTTSTRCAAFMAPIALTLVLLRDHRAYL